MPSPNLPPGFDFTDPDIYAERLPVEEFAELRATAPIWWNEQAPGNGGGFNDGGYWAITKLNDVKEVSRRSDVFSSYENGVIPRFNDDIAREDIELQRFVMLNMDAPHHTRLRRIISRGFTPRAIGRLRDELNERAQNIAKAAAAAGSGDFVEQVSCELPLAGDRRSARRAAGGPRQALPLVQRDDRQRRPGVRPHRSRRQSSMEVLTYAMQMAEDQGRRTRRRHRHHADQRRHRRREALRRRVRLLRDDARGGRQRDHPKLHHPGDDGVRRLPRPVGAVQEGTPGDRRRRDRPLGHPGHRRSSAPRWRTTSCPACRSRRASGC